MYCEVSTVLAFIAGNTHTTMLQSISHYGYTAIVLSTAKEAPK
jgi:hypothetical protein